jgi:LPXTG-motif cell wall-anchored protein
MNKTSAKLILFLGFAFLGAMVPSAAADEWDQKTIFTFSGPVEIPGQVLSAGTYVFKLADTLSDRNVVQVFSKNEKHLYGTFLSIPDQRLHPAGKPIITFDERAAGSPEAVRAWFYPGEDIGHQFVYPKNRAVALAKANNTPVPSMPTELAANTTKPAAKVNEPHVMEMRQAPLKAQKPTEEEADISEVFIAQASPINQPQLPAELPHTGSSLPLIGLVGLLSLGAALGMRFAAARKES